MSVYDEHYSMLKSNTPENFLYFLFTSLDSYLLIFIN